MHIAHVKAEKKISDFPATFSLVALRLTQSKNYYAKSW